MEFPISILRKLFENWNFHFDASKVGLVRLKLVRSFHRKFQNCETCFVKQPKLLTKLIFSKSLTESNLYISLFSKQQYCVKTKFYSEVSNENPILICQLLTQVEFFSCASFVLLSWFTEISIFKTWYSWECVLHS